MRTVTVPRLLHHRGQRKVIREAARFNVLACGRRWGKTLFGADLCIEPALSGKPVGYFAPSYRMLGEPFGIIERALGPLVSSASKTEKRIELVTGGVVEFWSISKADRARGHKYARVVMDESAYDDGRLPEAWANVVRPSLADLQGDAWFLSSPNGQNGFYDLFVRGQDLNQDLWRSWRMPTRTNPYIPRSEIDLAQDDMPEAAFQQEFLAEFLADAANPFGIQHIQACEIPGLSEETAAFFGWDLGKKLDWTVGVGMSARGEVCEFDRWQGIPWDKTLDRIVAVSRRRYGLVDSTGVGDPVMDFMRAAGEQSLEPFLYTHTSRQQLLEGLAVAIQGRLIRFPKDHQIGKELRMFRFEFSGKTMRYAAPEGAHDDAAMALALATRCWQTYGDRPRPPAVQISRFGGAPKSTPESAAMRKLQDFYESQRYRED